MGFGGEPGYTRMVLVCREKVFDFDGSSWNFMDVEVSFDTPHRSIHKANMDYWHQRCMDWRECGELWDDFLGQYWDYPMIFRHQSQTYRIYISYTCISQLICHSCIKWLVFDSVGEIPRLRMLWQGVLWRRCQR